MFEKLGHVIVRRRKAMVILFIVSVLTAGTVGTMIFSRLVVERILGHRLRGKSWTFHVAWRRHRERTWEPLKNLVHRGRVNASLWAYCRSHSLRRALKAAKALMIDD